MHKDFYASGFIYHPRTQQILLQQHNLAAPTSASWLLFSFPYSEKDKPEDIFKKHAGKLLQIEIKTICPIYTYDNEEDNKSHYLVYGLVNKMQEFPKKKGVSFGWFSFKDITKLKIDEQTKHDIIVGQRVIDAAVRKAKGEHTF